MSNTENKISFIERLGNLVGCSANSKAVFGEPLTQDNITIIPIAKVRHGFGGGYGKKQDEAVGKGGGGGIQAQPVGYIELRDNEATYTPIRQPLSIPSLIIATGIGSFFLAKALSCLVKR